MIKRELDLPKLLGKNNSVLLLGARGVGKTQLAQLAFKGMDLFAIDLLRFESYDRYLKEPHLLRAEIDRALVAKKRLAVFIDEIQRVPALLDEIHSAIEAYKGRLQFLLTGSSARKLKRGGANLLAGRALAARLHPLTSREIDVDLPKVLRLGSLPGILVGHESPELALASYVETYLKEEVLQEALVRRVDAFARFLELAGQYHGKTINASEIGKAAGVSAHTILEYFQILEDTLLGFRLPGWSASVRKQLRTAARFYLFDNGVANAIRGELKANLTERTGRWGKLFEAWVVQEAFRFNDYAGLSLKFSYWRTNNGTEVDLIVSRGAGKPLAAIEIKSKASPSSSDWNGLKAFATDYPEARLLCFSTTPRAYQEGDVEVVPWKDGISLLADL